MIGKYGSPSSSSGVIRKPSSPTRSLDYVVDSEANHLHTSVPLYAFTFTVPTIIKDLGYTAAQAQLLTVPPYVLGAITTVVAALLADKHQTRWPFIVFPYCVASIGFIGLLVIPHPAYPGLTYGWLFFITGGLYPPVITMASWLGNNLAPTWKRSVGIALGISLANAGGIVGSNIYIAKQAPRYWLGYGFSLGCVIVAILATFTLRFAYKSANKARDKMSEESIRANYTERASMFQMRCNRDLAN